MRLTNTAKAIILVEDDKLGKCVLLHKEANWNYWLPWGTIEKWEESFPALKRELSEELFYALKVNDEISHAYNEAKILKKKLISKFDTKHHSVNLYSVLLDNRYLKLSKEWKWIWLYPLEDKYREDRKALRLKMEPNAVIWIDEFKKKDWNKYDVNKWLRYWENDELIHDFRKELEMLKNEIKKDKKKN